MTWCFYLLYQNAGAFNFLRLLWRCLWTMCPCFLLFSSGPGNKSWKCVEWGLRSWCNHPVQVICFSIFIRFRPGINQHSKPRGHKNKDLFIASEEANVLHRVPVNVLMGLGVSVLQRWKAYARLVWLQTLNISWHTILSIK